MNFITSFVLARLKEPSTWRGLIALATAFGVSIRPEVSDAIIALGLALMGGVGVLSSDTPKPVPHPRVHDVPVQTSNPSSTVQQKRGPFDDLERFGQG